MDSADKLFLLIWIAPLIVGAIAGAVFVWRTGRPPAEEWWQSKD